MSLHKPGVRVFRGSSSFMRDIPDCPAMPVLHHGCRERDVNGLASSKQSLTRSLLGDELTQTWGICLPVPSASPESAQRRLSLLLARLSHATQPVFHSRGSGLFHRRAPVFLSLCFTVERLLYCPRVGERICDT